MNGAKRIAIFLVSSTLGVAIAAYVAMGSAPRDGSMEDVDVPPVSIAPLRPVGPISVHLPVAEPLVAYESSGPSDAHAEATAAARTSALVEATHPPLAADIHGTATIADPQTRLSRKSEPLLAPPSSGVEPSAAPEVAESEAPVDAAQSGSLAVADNSPIAELSPADSAILKAISRMRGSGDLSQLPPAAVPPPEDPTQAEQSQADEPSANVNAAPANAASSVEPLPDPNRIGISPAEGEGDDLLRVYIKDEDIRVVLAALSEQGGLNILPSQSVQGNVSASLNGVTVDTALDAILRSTGYVARREGAFIYVGTPLDFDAMAHTLDRIGTRIYRPNYVSAQELMALITPILTPQPIGKVVASSPAKVDIQSDDNKAGGNDFASTDAVLVQDYEAVLAAVDQVVAEIDRQPQQVAIEAMILSVRLNDTDQFGVDFQLLRNKKHLRLASGNALTDIAEVSFNSGLKFAFLDSNLGAFIDALETVGETNVVARPNLMVLNKQRAEILIGSELGYVSTSQTETSTTQNVNFLEVGAQLRLRPFISKDGMIRMEIHPELSQGTVRVEGGFTLPDKDVTKVTTNIMVRDGYTVVIGGLMRDDLTTTTSQIPVVGNLPLVGFLFRNKTEEIEKREILVLVTPHIVHEPDMYQEGEQGSGEFMRRHEVYQDKMSPLGKRSLGRKYFRLAQEAWERGERSRALKHVSLAIQFDPLNRAAIDLRSDIWSGIHSGDHSGGETLLITPSAPPDEEISPWIFDELERSGIEPSDAPRIEPVPPNVAPSVRPLRSAP